MTHCLTKPKNRLETYIHQLFEHKFETNKIHNKKIIELETDLLYKKPTYDVIKSMISKSNINPKFKKLKKVYVDPHAWERWNERVGPPIQKNDLINLIRTIILQFPERIRIESDTSDLASIDGDIIFGFKIKDNSIKINTFYGRKSLNNLLHDIDSLRIFNKNQNDKINLEMDEKVLRTMKKPLIPSKYIQFNVYKKELNKYMFVKCFIFYIHSRKHNKVIPYLYLCYHYSSKKNYKIKDFPLLMKKMIKMPLEVLLSLMLLNMHGSILMYITKFEEDIFSKQFINILNNEVKKE